MKKSILLIAGITLTIGIQSCKKEGCTDATATNYTVGATKDDGSCEYATNNTQAPTVPTYTPNFNGTFGALVAIKTVTTSSTPIGTVDTEVGTAVAVFTENSATNFVDAGTVNVSSNELTIQSNNSYVYQIGQSNPTGISYSDPVDWSGTGATWPSFSTSTSQGFSTVGTITTGDPSTSSDYTLTTSSISNADSILFVIAGQNGSVSMMKAGTETSHTFSSSEVSSVGAGTGIVQIVGLKYDLQNISTRDYYLINETVCSKTVTVE